MPQDGIDWKQVKEWDEKYYLHILKSEGEYAHVPIARTEGSYLYMPDGKKLLDFSSQLVCVNIDQAHPRIRQAIHEAVDRYGFVWEAFCTDYRAKAAKLIVEDLLGSEGWAGRVRFSNSGSEAVETALIIARLFTGRPNILTREYAYHGWTMGAAGCTKLRAVRSALTSPKEREIRDVPGFNNSSFHFAPAPFCYRCSLGHTYPSCKQNNGTLACVQMTESIIRTLGPETVAAMITEVVMGGGCVHPPAEYIPQIREMTRRLGILWIDDEVMCGFGRMGRWFAYQRYPGVNPDLMIIAKATTNSAIPIGGVVLTQEIADFLEGYRWWSINTFAAHPVAMAATCATIEVMREMDLPAVARKAGKMMEKSLLELQDKHPCIGLVSGSEGGMLWGVEMVRDRRTNEPFVAEDRYFLPAGDLKKFPNTLIREKCAEKGVLAGGVFPNTLRLAPPLTITEAELNQGIEALDYAFSEVDKLCV